MNVSLLSCHTYFAGLLFDALYQLWNGAIAPHDTFTVLYIQVREVTLLDSFIFPVKFVGNFYFQCCMMGYELALKAMNLVVP